MATALQNYVDIKQYETLQVTVPKPYLYHVEINRPNKMNAINDTMWREFARCFDELAENPDCRVIVLSAAGKHFSAGIDLNDFNDMTVDGGDVARKAKFFRNIIKTYQHSFNAMEKCNKPIICAIHSACIGGGVNLISAVDIRVCTKDAYFQLKEVAIGMAADVGALQRLPKIIGNGSLVREFCFTARKMYADEALSCGLVSKVYPNKESMLKGALELAEKIAEHSPAAVQGTKQALIYARDHSVQEGLDQIALWNQFMLQSEDLPTAVMAQMMKTTATFSKL